MTPEQADNLAYEFFDCLTNKTVFERKSYGPNLTWSSRMELRKALCIHLALMQLRGTVINERPSFDKNKNVTSKEWMETLSYYELLSEAFSRTPNFHEMGKSDRDFKDEKYKPDYEFEAFSQELAKLNIKSDTYWVDVLHLLGNKTSFSCID